MVGMITRRHRFSQTCGVSVQARHSRKNDEFRLCNSFSVREIGNRLQSLPR